MADNTTGNLVDDILNGAYEDGHGAQDDLLEDDNHNAIDDVDLLN